MLRACLIDDELPALLELEYLLKNFEDVRVEGLFQNPVDALEKIEAQKPDIVFLDIDMPYMNGLDLALKIQSLLPEIIIIFVTAFSDYALEAFKAYPLDYILKPVDEERFRKTAAHAVEQAGIRRPASEKRPSAAIRCFGGLDVKNTDSLERMNMANHKLRELFAYLVDRFDKTVTRHELIELLFDGVENKKTINHLHVLVYKLRSMLESFGLGRSSILIADNYKLEVAPNVCDYVDFVNFIKRNLYIYDGNVTEAERTLSLYTGDYLGDEDYLWSVETREWLYGQFEALLIKTAEYYGTAGEIRRTEQLLNRLLEYHPLSERANHLLLDFYYKHGDARKYIKSYNKYFTILREEFNMTPEGKYAAIYEKMLTRL